MIHEYIKKIVIIRM